MGIEANIRAFNVDSISELILINETAKELGETANVAFRINPNVNPKTHPKISTGLKKNKFGLDVESGIAMKAIKMALEMEYVNVVGVHCHIGSQLTDISPFIEETRKVMDFVVELKEEGIEIEDEAVDELLELVENNTDALKMACSHLVLYFQKGSHIDQENIEKLFAHNKEETPFSLFNALTMGSLETALSISQKIILSKNSSPVQIIAGLSYCFRRLQDWHKIHRDNEYLDDFALKRFGFLGKTALAQYKLWNEVQCVKIIALLSETDLELRSLGTSLQNIVMDMCLYEIACKSGNKIEKYTADNI